MVLSRMEEGNVTNKGNVSNNLRQLFPRAKVGCRIDCEASPLRPFLLQIVLIQRRILKTVKHLQWSFLRN